MFVQGILILSCLFDYLGSGYSFCSFTIFGKPMQSFLFLSELENDSAVAALGLLWAVWGYSTFFSGQNVYHFNSSCQNRRGEPSKVHVLYKGIAGCRDWIKTKAPLLPLDCCLILSNSFQQESVLFPRRLETGRIKMKFHQPY